jgi:hypothetical protein
MSDTGLPPGDLLHNYAVFCTTIEGSPNVVALNSQENLESGGLPMRVRASFTGNPVDNGDLGDWNFAKRRWTSHTIIHRSVPVEREISKPGAWGVVGRQTDKVI